MLVRVSKYNGVTFYKYIARQYNYNANRFVHDLAAKEGEADLICLYKLCLINNRYAEFFS